MGQTRQTVVMQIPCLCDNQASNKGLGVRTSELALTAQVLFLFLYLSFCRLSEVRLPVSPRQD
jgi:hypothetical protein